MLPNGHVLPWLDFGTDGEGSVAAKIISPACVDI
jgi:hypothetical protein